MTDYFSVLGETQRPWLDPELLKQKFLALSTESHPDRVHSLTDAERRQAQERYTELNAAYNCLREPRSRLRHLLELQRGAPPTEIQQIPSDLMNLFMEVGLMLRHADAFLAERNKVTSALIRAQLFERGEECAQKLQEMQSRVRRQITSLEDELKSLDPTWITPTRADILGRLEEIYRLLGYFERWNAQIRERIVQISF